ncbi:910_t:CDS:2 [Funneliformis mosseae]|uniref:910_t:CDS:1 n=1 Tax=Funneliformis mosseae TaxID=27381 RepID=A0A9N9CL22_FUNMO|nr:910_t:CDS:2 [Funneliformis mosseae]
MIRKSRSAAPKRQIFNKRKEKEQKRLRREENRKEFREIGTQTDEIDCCENANRRLEKTNQKLENEKNSIRDTAENL